MALQGILGMKKIKICYVIDIFNVPGGTENHLSLLTAYLDRQRFSPMICPLWPSDSAMIRAAREHGTEVRPTPVKRVYGISAARQIVNLARIFRKERIDIVQTYHFMSDVIGTAAAKLAGVPIILSSRRDNGFIERGFYFGRIRRLLNKGINLSVAVSDDLRLQISRAEKRPLGLIRTIRNGSDRSNFDRPYDRKKKLEELGLPRNARIIGTIGNIRPIKGVQYLVAAAAQISTFFPDVECLIVGGDATLCDDYKKSLQDLIVESGLQSKVHFLGPRQDVAELLQLLDVFVLPSLSEGFSNALIEAMHAGKGIVATDVGGNSEAIENNKSGILVPVKDARALADAVIRLLSSPNELMRLGIAAQNRARALFSTSRMVREYETMYETLLERSRGKE